MQVDFIAMNTAAEHHSKVYKLYTLAQNMYTSSPASSATASVCSDASSQLSHFSDTSTSFSDLSSHSYSLPDGSALSCQQGFTRLQAQPAAPEVDRLRGNGLTGTWPAAPAPEVHWSLRQNARRTSNSATTRIGCPPPLVRQAERKLNFVDNLVGKWC